MRHDISRECPLYSSIIRFMTSETWQRASQINLQARSFQMIYVYHLKVGECNTFDPLSPLKSSQLRSPVLQEIGADLRWLI